MSLRSVARSVRDGVQDLKNALRIPVPWLAAKRRGDISLRVAHFDQLLAEAKGKTLLDVGCYDGLIAYEFVRAGATLVHGIDNDPYHLATARRIFTQVALPSTFTHADLRRDCALTRALGTNADRRFDIVLFLGVYQHIYTAMRDSTRRALVRGVCDRTASLLAARMPTAVWQEFERHFPEGDFTLLYRIPQEGSVGEMRIWRRNPSGAR